MSPSWLCSWYHNAGIGGSLLLLFFVGALGCLEFQRRKIKALRDKHFKSNGGVFLQELVSAHRSAFKIFSLAELKKATNNFSKANIVGRGGFGVVYKGETEDHIPIAVKKSTMVNEKNSRGFANELFILSQVNHNNIVKLLGCCLEDEMPMLIYEFISVGTLFDYIHSIHERSIGFNARLRIAAKVAEAFKYMHLDASPPVLHGDVKSVIFSLMKIFNRRYRISAHQNLHPNDNTKFTTLVQGTCGYLDPEYLTTGALTDKSDVFGFGVVLLELLTRDAERILYVDLLSCVKTNKLLHILDPALVEQGLSVEVEVLAEIASDCLKMEGEKRPTMKEVALRLGSIKVSEEVLAWYPSSSHGTKETKPLLEGPSSTSSFAHPQQAIFSVEMDR